MHVQWLEYRPSHRSKEASDVSMVRLRLLALLATCRLDWLTALATAHASVRG